MRMVLASATFAFATACGGTAENKGGGDLGTHSNLIAPPENGSAPTAAAADAVPSRVGGAPAVYEPNAQRGGITQALSGEEGGAGGMAASRAAMLNDLNGRWAYNCNTGVGPLVFSRGGRFTAPGGSGRFQMSGNFVLTFTFADGETESYEANMTPGSLSLEPRRALNGGRNLNGGAGIDRVRCSETP